jgi:hypothetical protein
MSSLRYTVRVEAPERHTADIELRFSPDADSVDVTMPAWAPRTGERAWLAFTSARPYGAVLPTAGRGQIWVTSLDLTLTGDPSTAAFWLPCQDATVLNNNPVWSTTDFTQ